MNTDLPPALLDWARLPGPTKVLTKARRRLEDGHGVDGSPLRVNLTADERRDVGRLLGTAWALSARPVRLRALADALAEVGSDLKTLLESLHGPMRDRPAERAAARAAAEAERRAAAQELVQVGVTEHEAQVWLSSHGLPRAGTGQLRQFAMQVAAVLRKLPANNETVLLSVLAAAALGDPHGLDRGSRVATGVLRLAARRPDDPELTGVGVWRSAWESLGVVCDELSSRVLVLNLPLVGDAAACRLTAVADGEPLWLTWRSLNGTFTTHETDVFVCENPAVLAAAAARLGTASRPVICTNGWPSAATRRLITGLASAGTRLSVRADDDQAGQRIVAEICAIAPAARLWRYIRRPLSFAPGRYEEQDLDVLLADLAAPSGESAPGLLSHIDS